MNTKQAIVELKKLGFKFTVKGVPSFGVTTPEAYNGCWPDHFTPKSRSVFFAKCNGGFYVTSHLRGDFRYYRGRKTHENYTVSNIFGGGKTLAAAITEFVRNFKSKTYNVTP